MTEQTNTYGGRIEQYKRRVKLSTWLGASLAAYVALFFGADIPETPVWLEPMIISIILISAVSAAYTRVGFEWRATLLKREQKKNGVDDSAPLPDEHLAWPRTEWLWTTFLISYLVSGVAFIIAIWLEPIRKMFENSC